MEIVTMSRKMKLQGKNWLIFFLNLDPGHFRSSIFAVDFMLSIWILQNIIEMIATYFVWGMVDKGKWTKIKSVMAS